MLFCGGCDENSVNKTDVLPYIELFTQDQGFPCFSHHLASEQAGGAFVYPTNGCLYLEHVVFQLKQFHLVFILLLLNSELFFPFLTK